MAKNEWRYLIHVYCLLPVKGKDERQFLKNLRRDLREFLTIHQDSSYELLTKEFGSPLDTACSYLASKNSGFWMKRIRLKKRMLRFTCAVLLGVICGLCLYTHYLIGEYYNTMDQAVAGYTETIEVLDEDVEYNEE